jgi:hypothetical protein
MQIQPHFLQFLCTYIAKTFEEGQSSKSLFIVERKIPTIGIGGKCTTTVYDAVLAVKIEDLVHSFLLDFFNDKKPLRNKQNEVREVENLLKSSFAEKHDRALLKSRITDAITRRSLLASCEMIQVDQGVVYNYLRVRSYLSTQLPKVHLPLFQGDFKEVVELRQTEFAITHFKSEKPVLATWHLVSCYAIVGFSKDFGIGFMCHSDSGQGVFRALQMIKSIVVNQWGLNKISFDIDISGGSDFQDMSHHTYNLQK